MEHELAELGTLIEQTRLRAGRSARAVADAAGLSPAYLRAIERGRNPKTKKASRPSPEALVGVARALSLEPEELLGLAGYDPAIAQGLLTASGTPARGGIDDYLRQIQEAVKKFNRLSPFMHDRALARLADFSADFRAIAGGTLRVTPEEEPHLTRLAVKKCEDHLRAVSYQDEPWWQGPPGDSYLELHEELKQNDVRMTRIFLVREEALESLRPTFERHVELGIETYVLMPDQVNEYYWRDFVVYDDVLLRTAAVTDPTTDRKTAEFTDDPGRIAQALGDFNALKDIAETSFASLDRVLSEPHE